MTATCGGAAGESSSRGLQKRLNETGFFKILECHVLEYAMDISTGNFGKKGRYRGEVFISFPDDQWQLVNAIKAQFDLLQLKTWEFRSELGYGREVQAEIQNAISRSDHFLVVLDSKSCTSEWVQRELGLALKLRHESKGRRPVIHALWKNEGRAGAQEAELELPIRDWESGAITGHFSWASLRRLRLNEFDDLKTLRAHFCPTVTVVYDPVDHADLFAASLSLYEDMFPPAERDAPGNIRRWLEEQGRHGSPWIEMYAILHLKDSPIGMAYLTGHKSMPWWFGNYLCVARHKRSHANASAFLEKLVEEAQETNPETIGILFEVERPDADAIDPIVSGHGNSLGFNHSKARDELRRFKRLHLYDSHGCLALVDGGGNPVPYVQPFLELGENGSDARSDVSMVLMCYSLGRVDPSGHVRSAIEFIYEVFSGTVDERTAEFARRYRGYLQREKSVVLSRIDDMTRFAQLSKCSEWFSRNILPVNEYIAKNGIEIDI